MECVTTHDNADFDTFASMVAVKKLYPAAHLVFSGSLEARLRDAIETVHLPYDIERMKDVDLDKITTLILVDVRQASRIGRFASVIGRPGVKVHVYDHHPPTGDDVAADELFVEPYGATTTVLTRILKERGIEITPSEATIMMAGIYEDTGSLTYASTTVADFEAAGHLLSCGADLAVVTTLLRRELTPDEVSLLNEFLQSGAVYSVCGADILIVSGYLERYAGDIAVLAHKIVEIEKAGCLFMLADSSDRVHVIARSRAPEVDAGAVMRLLGGGGHAYAASATIKGITLVQAKERLIAALRKTIKPLTTAEDIMSHPAITFAPDITVAEAGAMMRRYNINAAPVADKAGLLGVITKQVADKAAHHGLGDSALSDYMTTECETVTPSTSVDEIREKVVSHGARLLPVIKGGSVAGVITRTDLLKLLQDGLRREAGSGEAKTRSLARLMRERLPGWAFDMLKEAGTVADGLGCKAYLVGGFVRDLLLHRANLDMDIVIEAVPGGSADGIAFAAELAKRRGARVKSHQRFKTAVVVFADGFKVDVATARLEYYESPGSLPTVEQSSLKLDLYRRDFIINTLAVGLNPGRFGELVDFFGARKDIKEKTIRVLHNLSFVEDPTRMLRAVRFSEKFGFKIGKHTLNLMKNSVKLDVFKDLAGIRLFEELKNILVEETVISAISALHLHGILRLIHKGITWDVGRVVFFERAKETLAWHELLYTKDTVEDWLVLFLALTDPLTQAELDELAERLTIAGRKVHAVISARRARADKESERKAISAYITRLRAVRCELTGADLMAMGFSEGPAIGETLAGIFRLRCDGEVSTRQQEEAYAKTALKKGAGA
ncbi:MAG: CBS domain-containing protein [Deltaproteobacteria bacterium]|nr:CBS domain-containing protein [Deltaproteobacteria bacterium]